MVARYRDTFDNVLLVDAGDHIQGTAYGSMDKGSSIVDLMNAAKYDAATLGNHEFDYGMEGVLATIEEAEYPYLSCNFYHEENGEKGENVLDSYKVFEVGGQKIALIGITTPESFTKSTPAYFQDENGNYIYGIAGGNDGSELYDTVQETIDEASQEADVIIGLGHLGVDPSSIPWTSEEVIANTTGFDAFIDGHSHTTLPMEVVLDEEENEVILTQTGSYFGALGQMTISPEGEITTELLGADNVKARLFDNYMAQAAAGDYRVKNVQILDRGSGEYKPLDVNAKYNLAGYNYTLRDLGDGFSMFSGATNIIDYVMEDYMVLANYVQSFEDTDGDGLPNVTGYADVNGEGRITIE